MYIFDKDFPRKFSCSTKNLLARNYGISSERTGAQVNKSGKIYELSKSTRFISPLFGIMENRKKGGCCATCDLAALFSCTNNVIDSFEYAFAGGGRLADRHNAFAFHLGEYFRVKYGFGHLSEAIYKSIITYLEENCKSFNFKA